MAPLASRGSVNLRTTLEKIVIRAGCKPWPRLLQNLRSSCATDWVEKYRAHVAAKWLGHSPNVAAAHFLQAREHTLRTWWRAAEPVRSAAQIAAHQQRRLHRSTFPKVPARSRTKRQNPRPPLGEHGFLRNRTSLEDGPNGQHRIRTCDLYGVNVAL